MRQPDVRQIILMAGNGGHGAISFDRGASIPFGRPNGGNGAIGSHIILKATHSLAHLGDLKSKYSSLNGGNGRNKNQHGRMQPNLIVNVPIGTIISKFIKIVPEKQVVLPHIQLQQHLQSWKSSHVEEQQEEWKFVQKFDLAEHDSECLVAKGGYGGKGNPYFSSFQNSPRKRQLGQSGEQVMAKLELKTLADVGLVGFPNSGKSSLVRCLTNSNTTVADYQFTTLYPSVGIALSRDYFLAKTDNRKLTTPIKIADIPGLIEGASLNKGLGHRFLRHIERCKMLLIVVSVENSKILDLKTQFNIIRSELKSYNPQLLELPYKVIVNKSDLLQNTSTEDIYTLFNTNNVLLCSALNNTNIRGPNGLGISIIDSINK